MSCSDCVGLARLRDEYDALSRELRLKVDRQKAIRKEVIDLQVKIDGIRLRAQGIAYDVVFGPEEKSGRD